MEPRRIEFLDLKATVTPGGSGAVAGWESSDLDINLVQFADGAGVGSHVNPEVDVLLLALSGSGTVMVDGDVYDLQPQQAVLIPRDAERSITSQADGSFVYLTVHRRRRGLWPKPLGAS